MSTTNVFKKVQYAFVAATLVAFMVASPVAATTSTDTNGKRYGHSKKQTVTTETETVTETTSNETVSTTKKSTGVVSDKAVATTQSNVSTKSNVPKGNNGTLKVHEYGTPRATENNDPKVCVFNFEGFGFDIGQDGYIVITGQGQSKGAKYGPFNFGPTVAANEHRSFAETAYFNKDGGVQIANGHYKATLYGKQNGNQVDYRDVKAKSKVFKVNCEGHTLGTSTTDVPKVLPSTGNEVAVILAVSTAVAVVAGAISYALKSTTAKLF